VALTPLIVAVTLVSRSPSGTARRAFALGVTAGLIYFLGTLYWVTGVMGLYGGLPTPVAALIAILLAAYLALYPGLFALLLRQAIRRFGAGAIWIAPLLWTASEWGRSTIGGGFPWVLLGSSQARVIPIVQAASVVGVYGLSALVALVSTAAAAVALGRGQPGRVLGTLAVAVLLVATAAGGAWRVQSGALLRQGAPARIGLVQGSVPQDDKYDERYAAAILNRYLTLSRSVIQAGADLVIWPEASTPFYLDADAPKAAPIRRLAADTRTPFIIGTDEFEPGRAGSAERYYNAAVLVDADGRSRGSYRKMHLVPFGEYVPLKRLLFFVGPLIESVGDFSAGTTPVVFEAAGRRLSVAICYESVYPALSRAFVAHGSQLLVTITNDAWFGRSSAAYQHFDQGAMRAVEEGRFVVRAANTGITGAVDPYGRVLASTELFVPTAITVDVRLLDGRTLYSRMGDLVVWLSLLAAGWVVVSARPAGGRRLRSRSVAR
jgi:apolipoprotein N-acyltransferase